MEFRAIMMAFLSISRPLLPRSQWVNGQLPRSGSQCNTAPSLILGIFEGICPPLKRDRRGASYTHTQNFRGLEVIREESEICFHDHLSAAGGFLAKRYR